MKINFNRLITDLNRNLNNQFALLKALTVWAAVAVFIGGIFGIYPQAKTLVTNINLYSKMLSTNKALEEKIETINNEYTKVEQNANPVSLLDFYLPDSYGIQNYIVDLSFASSKNGFGLVSLTTREKAPTEDALVVDVGFIGNGKVGDLVGTIESLKRIAQINKVSFTNSNNEVQVNMNISVYVMGDK